jgi:hypothetical protein
MKTARHRIDVNLEELDRVLDDARQAPLSEADHNKLRNTLHTLTAMLSQLLRLPGRVAAPCPGTGRLPRGMDAVELSLDSGTNRGPRIGRVMMNPIWPERIVFGHARRAS